MKIFLYEKLGIDNNQENNSNFENFIKWVIDSWVLDNYDLLVQIYETNWKIILDWLEKLLTWEWLKNLAESLKEDLWTLWDWNAYEKWKVSAEVVLWLITAWAWITINVVKKWVKQWIKLTTKQIAKLRVNKERIVENSEIKKVVWDTRNKVDEVVSKQELDLKIFSFNKINDILDNNNIFDINKWNTLKSWLTNKEFISFLENNIELKSLLDKYKKKFWNVIDPDNFRELFLEYNGINSSQFDEIVWKLSKLYYRIELINLKDKKSIHLIGWAPWSWKSTALKFNNSKTPENFGLVFDSTLNDIRFLDYLINEAKLNWINNISISFIHRKPDLAWEWIVKRSIKEKRPVNLSYFIDTYKKIWNVISELEKRWFKWLQIIDNSAWLKDIKQISIKEFKNIFDKNIDKNKLIFITNKIIDSEIYKPWLSKEEIILLEKLRKELNN
jgi:hypothetical protein